MGARCGNPQSIQLKQNMKTQNHTEKGTPPCTNLVTESVGLDAIAEHLEKKGFVVLPHFLNDQDISGDMIDWLGGAQKFKDGVIQDIPPAFLVPIRRKIADLIPNLAQRLGLSIHPDRYAYCAIRVNKTEGKPELRLPFDVNSDPKVSPGGVLNWHLDHFSYYLCKDHANYLICYMPVRKPDTLASNVAIVPNDTLQALDPESHARLKSRGAVRFRCVEKDTKPWFEMRFPSETLGVGDWFAVDDFYPQPGWKMKINLEEHKVIPALAEKDLLIMKADVIHRTQDASIDRVSIRCDATPLRAKPAHSWFGQIFAYLGLIFEYEKVRYNKRIWLRKELVKKWKGFKGAVSSGTRLFE